MSRITELFTVPVYYEKFRCKGGACRHTCCAGLSVNISEDEYFRLLGVNCSKALRRELDVALRPLKNADPYRYACISPNFFGQCRLLDPGEDENRKGLCRLQEECGADALPATCQYFPRSPRLTGSCQCAMANACEETLELLYDQEDWETQQQELTFTLAGTVQLDQGRDALEKLRTHETLLKELIRTDMTALVKSQIAFAARNQTRLLHLVTWAGENYASVQPYCEIAVLRSLQNRSLYHKENLFSGLFDQANAAQTEQFMRGIAGVRTHFPAFDRFFRLALINDLFWRFYPFTGDGIQLQEAERALPYMAGMLLLLCAANLNETAAKEELIDLFAGFFRMVELTAFDHNCLVMLGQ